MSSQSAASIAITAEATLNAILHCLDAIEVKMEPLQDQVTVLESAVRDHAAHQLELDGEVHRLVEAQSAQSVVRP
jgi:hypothetical protein